MRKQQRLQRTCNRTPDDLNRHNSSTRTRSAISGVGVRTTARGFRRRSYTTSFRTNGGGSLALISGDVPCNRPLRHGSLLKTLPGLVLHIKAETGPLAFFKPPNTILGVFLGFVRRPDHRKAVWVYGELSGPIGPKRRPLVGSSCGFCEPAGQNGSAEECTVRALSQHRQLCQALSVGRSTKPAEQRPRRAPTSRCKQPFHRGIPRCGARKSVRSSRSCTTGSSVPQPCSSHFPSLVHRARPALMVAARLMKLTQRRIAAETGLCIAGNTHLTGTSLARKSIAQPPALSPLPYGLAMTQQSPVAVAEELLQLVKLLHPVAASADARDAQKMYDARKRVQQLSNSITRSVCGPLEYTIILAESCHESAALRFVTEYGVADAIGDTSKSLLDICSEVQVNFRYMDVAMKCLCSHGYFEEVGGFNTRVFRNNAMSEVLRTEHPQTLKDAIGFICDEGGKATSFLVEAARTTPSVVDSPTPAVNLAFGFEGPVFQHWAEGAHAWRGKRLGHAMKQLHQVANGNVIADFQWSALQSPVVDVGGGIGALELALVRAYPDSAVNFVVFDIAETLGHARTVWEAQPHNARRRVSFVAGDFLAPTLAATRLPCGQPTYLIRHVLHDWTDEQVVAILQNVRAAMLAPPPAENPTSDHGIYPVHRAPGGAPKLLLCEMLLQERSGRFAYTTSLQVLALNNGIIRTEAEIVDLLQWARFRVVAAHAMRAVDTIIEAVPLGV